MRALCGSGTTPSATRTQHGCIVTSGLRLRPQLEESRTRPPGGVNPARQPFAAAFVALTVAMTSSATFFGTGS
jgi:hypothetical protein